MVVLGGLFRGVLVLVEVLGVVFGAGLGGDRFRRGAFPAADRRAGLPSQKTGCRGGYAAAGKYQRNFPAYPDPGRPLDLAGSRGCSIPKIPFIILLSRSALSCLKIQFLRRLR